MVSIGARPLHPGARTPTMAEDTFQTIDELSVPAAPWTLHGSACLSLWRVRAVELPVAAVDIPYLRLAAHALVATVFATYSGGTLRYDELAAVVLVRGRGLLVPAGTVKDIWVNDPVSAAGGRRLWHIPKKIARFETGSRDDEQRFTGRMFITDERVASLNFEPKMALPGRLPVSGFVIQPGRGGPLRTRCTVSGKVLTGRARWEFAASSPLGFLCGRKPLLSIRICGLQASFGV
ncbi:acetoacetate decarboxylase family protein [Pseudomonas stutzeri]|uniref:acetoacetate decarboxylase family protein n=1 Tax=Stutzerimonas stutzeri TaxID=316 RepID=UPI00210AA917|nr:acetoacetate decarboxylase family protein [Stutzerimonas stutzeri]